MEWPAAKASKVLKALLRIGWTIKRQKGSHRILSKSGWPDATFAFHEREVPRLTLLGVRVIMVIVPRISALRHLTNRTI